MVQTREKFFMIWIGTSGWIYAHWIGHFYPRGLPPRDHLTYYAQHFPTVEINSSFYRLPSYEQFRTWSKQVDASPHFRFAVKASRYLTHMKKLLNAEDGIAHLESATRGLDQHLGPFLYQLPPRWHANVPRLAQFLTQLPHTHQVAFEFRDATWFESETRQAIRRIFDEVGCALVISVGGTLSTPLDLPLIGSFGYVRFHHGAHSIGFSDEELGLWARRLLTYHEQSRECYAYFNNDMQRDTPFIMHNAFKKCFEALPSQEANKPGRNAYGYPIKLPAR